MQKKEHKIN